MSTIDIAFLAMVVIGFAAFMVTLAYGQIVTITPERKTTQPD